MPDQSGKTVIVTGGASGMGWYCAKALAEHGAHVMIASRSLDRTQKAAQMIMDGKPSGKVEAMHLDLTSFQSITDFAKAFKAKKLPLHTLVNNAGVFLVPHDFTQEGFETTVGTNYFGHFLLTHLLLDTIKETATGSAPTRIVSMASLFELLGFVNWGDLEGYNARESGIFEYATSKVEVIMMVRELNKRLKGSNVDVFVAQPGLVQTELNGRKLDHRKLSAVSVDLAAKLIGQKADRASFCLQRPSSDPSVTGYGGSYFSPPWLWLAAINLDHAGMREPGNSLARDEPAMARLYDKTIEIVNKKLAEKNLGKIEPASPKALAKA
ncbi:hypothetical protein WJX81_000665 [Elliptochloris bilobata]|uniref:Uncharacterized protein n=1 Tax=Elliptochloris bilobata TaxID=381761 RepID=A0AAW1RZK8_9CHLO